MKKTAADGVYERGCIVALVAVVLAIGATVVSANYYQPRGPDVRSPVTGESGGGSLTAGFPIPFLEDDTSSSPTDGWGRIDAADWESPDPLPFLMDILFYTVLFWIAFHGVLRLAERRHLL